MTQALGNPRDLAGHRQWLEVAPWYVNGTIEGDERAAFEAHLAGCAECQREIELLRTVADVEKTWSSAVAPHPARFESLMSKASRRDRRLDSRLRSLARDAWHERRGAPGMWLAVAAQSVLVGVLLVFLVATRGQPREQAVYRTLTTPVEERAPSDTLLGGALLRLVFAEGVTEEQALALVRELGGRVLTGPSPLGVVTVEIAATTRGAALDGERRRIETPEDLIARLRSDPRLRFVTWVE